MVVCWPEIVPAYTRYRRSTRSCQLATAGPIISQHRKKRSKQKLRTTASWWTNEKWPWLHHREVSDLVICYYCSSAHERELLPKRLYSKHEDTYVTKGFVNWKDACASFRVHATTKYHVDAVKSMTKLQNDVGEMLSRYHNEEKKLNVRMLQIIMFVLPATLHCNHALQIPHQSSCERALCRSMSSSNLPRIQQP